MGPATTMGPRTTLITTLMALLVPAATLVLVVTLMPILVATLSPVLVATLVLGAILLLVATLVPITTLVPIIILVVVATSVPRTTPRRAASYFCWRLPRSSLRLSLSISRRALAVANCSTWRRRSRSSSW